MAFTISRRRLFALPMVALVLAACSDDDADDSFETHRPETPDEALTRLLEGNRRYLEGRVQAPNRSSQHREAVARGQEPWAVVWGCIDSRVPPELVFDQGLGDLFVVRTAGAVADAISIGSVEFGVAEFDVPLVMVLAHERCGAVSAAKEIVEGHGAAEGNLASVVEAIRPAIERSHGRPGDPLENAVRANLELQIAALAANPLIAEHVAARRMRLVGARYDLDGGVIEVIA